MHLQLHTHGCIINMEYVAKLGQFYTRNQAGKMGWFQMCVNGIKCQCFCWSERAIGAYCTNYKVERRIELWLRGDQNSS